MRYEVQHITNYKYKETVSLCYSEAILLPRDTVYQNCESVSYKVEPKPDYCHIRKDYFGNNVLYFELQTNYEALDITVNSIVDNTIGDFDTHQALRVYKWEDVAKSLGTNIQPEYIDASQFMLESPLIKYDNEVSLFASNCFSGSDNLLDNTIELMRRIYKEFKYVSNVTDIYTPITEVLSTRRGVCQDFAQLAIGCLRSLGLAARYVSGYIENVKKDDKGEMLGADQSHAWFSVYFPEFGWVDFDPTNNKFPADQHITVAWGRDFSDISPVKGVLYGSTEHDLEVTVSVKRVDK